MQFTADLIIALIDNLPCGPYNPKLALLIEGIHYSKCYMNIYYIDGHQVRLQQLKNSLRCSDISKTRVPSYDDLGYDLLGKTVYNESLQSPGESLEEKAEVRRISEYIKDTVKPVYCKYQQDFLFIGNAGSGNVAPGKSWFSWLSWRAK